MGSRKDAIRPQGANSRPGWLLPVLGGSGAPRWKYRTNFSDAWGNPLVSLQKTTPALAGKKITFSFLPASQSDLDLINSYLPQPHPDGTPIQPSELPSSLPGYLIHLKAEIRVDGQVVQQSGGAPTMGTELLQTAALYNPATGQWEEGSPNRPIAGEYHAIALDLQGIGSNQLTALQARLEQTKAKLEQFQQNPNDTTPVQNLTKEDLSGDLLYAGILGYFASVDGADRLAARSSKTIVNYRMPSYGAFSATAQPLYWFGIPRNVRFPGVTMDVDYLHTQATAKDADPQKRIAYLRQTGAAGSAFEHAVPEKLFIDPNTCNVPGTPTPDPNKPACAQGVSAVKAIAIAAQQGQKVYTFNQANQSLHAALLSQVSIEAEARQEIQNALAAGLEVTVHAAPITVSGWTGSGYIILDKVTGAGAYKISGGANGGALYKNKLPHFIQHFLFEQAIKLEPVLAGAEFALGDAVESLILQTTCLSDTQKSAFLDAVSALNWLNHGGLVPATPGMTLDIATIAGWMMIASFAYHLILVNRAIGDC